MKIHRLKAVQRLPIPIDEAWAFFSHPKNLRAITPPWMDFRITNEVPEVMYRGALITYTVRPLLGLRINWVTEITHLEEPRFFVDEQRFGPYRFWHHQHLFREADGGTEMTDIVDYALPFGPLGELAHRFSFRSRVEGIFAYRRQALIERFGTPKPPH
jgi:ligand-binding SRPBCC domain-containing protein